MTTLVRFVTLACAGLVGPAAAAAQSVPVPAHGLPTGVPEEAGLSSAALTRIGSLMQGPVDSGRLGGVLVAVARRGRLAYLETFGHADLSRDARLQPDAVFRIYSMTKPVTAVAVMRLIEQGRLTLDDPVSKYIPTFANMQVYVDGGTVQPRTTAAVRPITIRDLLAHTSGMAYGLGSAPPDSMVLAWDPFVASRTVAGFADSLARLPLAVQPGSRFRYGPGLEVLARVVEVVSSRGLDQYLQDDVFEPLGMRSTSFRLTADLRARLVTPYERGADGRLQPVRELLAADNYEPGARFVCGGCGLLSTAGDLLRFAQMLLNGGELDGVRILRPETVALMRRNALPPESVPIATYLQGPGYGHGLGVAVQVEPATPANPTAAGTFGWAGAANTFFWIDPENELIGLFLAQHFPSFATNRLVTELKRIVYAALPARPHIGANDNRRPAGTLRDGVLTLRLVAQDGLFFPDGEDGRSMPMQALGEEGGAPTSPAPLIRVPAGTEVRVSVRNTLQRALTLRGLSDHANGADSVLIVAPGEVGETRFRAPSPGTYFYWARTTPIDARERHPAIPGGEDSQLLGAFVVDPAPGSPPGPPDRVFVMTTWFEPLDQRALAFGPHEVITVNGRSWPFTERLEHTVGDTIRWRIVNGTFVWHPMHLHGFYYHVDSRGDEVRDTVYASRERRLVVTEWMRSGSTMTMTWTPTRPGNWLFHCHLVNHIAAELRLTPVPRANGHGGHGANHALEGMAGLVMGIHVQPRAGEPLVLDEPPPARRHRLYVNTRTGGFGDAPALGFVLQDGARPPAPDSIRIPGSTIQLVRNQPTEITVVNRTADPVTVHWHGIELQSYYDGVGDWSGAGARTAPPIAPGDSFVVRFTPDRAGTFIYHTHTDESQQLSSGLYGPLIVLEPGQVADTITDRIFLLGRGGPRNDAPPWVNGSADPPPIVLDAGHAYRFRLINITPSAQEVVELRDGTGIVQWRAIAKDGADLPPGRALLQPARVHMGAGETWDFEVTPREPGEWVLATTVMALGRPPATVNQRFIIRPRD